MANCGTSAISSPFFKVSAGLSPLEQRHRGRRSILDGLLRNHWRRSILRYGPKDGGSCTSSPAVFCAFAISALDTVHPLTEIGLVWWLGFFKSIDIRNSDNEIGGVAPERPCYRSVHELSFRTVFEENASVSVEDFPVYQVFPNVAKLNLHLHTIYGGDLLPQQLQGLHNLTYLRLFVDNPANMGHRIPVLHGLLTELLQLQHLELDRFGVPPSAPLDDIPDVFPGRDTPLVHSGLKTLIITDAFNFPMFMFSVFPALERLVIGSRFYGSFSIYLQVAVPDRDQSQPGERLPTMIGAGRAPK
ncbi:hypothetical protein BKA70DRAFT_1528532, partial [Coprinopsis sp. MPI-PUGE-AT-0042]